MRIGEFRQKIDELEAKWAAEDDKYMGKFEDQEILIPVFQWNELIDGFDYKGYGKDLLVFWDITGLGLLVEDAAILEKCRSSASSTVCHEICNKQPQAS